MSWVTHRSNIGPGSQYHSIVHPWLQLPCAVVAASRRAPAPAIVYSAHARRGACPPAPRRQLLRTGGACGNSTALRVPTIARPPLPI
ncbi:jg14333 [Pararge aegeria aegeria]|uniref:Jg14333 protein n=1 Tax=Pararge aegeria aegeria TaxID=348720 RepID=A0A8S4R4G5_9NEOP|nr:jg14333 [Pararge aegeria aegeria]